MEINKIDIKDLSERIKKVRNKIIRNYPFYGYILVNLPLKFGKVGTACTDGKNIIYDPDFIYDLNENELEFVTLHEIMHVILKHTTRLSSKKYFPNLANIACDIVVNSNILYSKNMDLSSIKIKNDVFMHLTPLKDEGYLYTAEEVYNMLLKYAKIKNIKLVDNHSIWGENEELNDTNGDFIDTLIFNGSKSCSMASVPPKIMEEINKLTNPKLNWKEILNQFISLEVNDYSFNPPDRRFNDFPFFLPDYNDASEQIKNLLFMVDTSGSMSDDAIVKIYSEIKSAIDQYSGKLTGKLGFFDTRVYDPIPFKNTDDLLKIKPKGRGGTNFKVIFPYIFEKMKNDLPVAVIIMTDGICDFPPKEVAKNIPVLWVITSEVQPPWGKVINLDIN